MCTISSRPRKPSRSCSKSTAACSRRWPRRPRWLRLRPVPSIGSIGESKWLMRVSAVIRMKALTDQDSDAVQMSFPAYVHGMLKTEAFAGVIRPDEENAKVVFRVPAERKPEQSRAGTSVLADFGRCPGRRPPLSRRLPLRLHRTDAEPVLADGHHSKSIDQPGPGPEGNSTKAHEPEYPANRRCSRARQGLEGLRTQSSVRPVRGFQDGRRGCAATGRHAAFRRRLGVVLRLWRTCLAAHDRLGRAWSASGPRQ